TRPTMQLASKNDADMARTDVLQNTRSGPRFFGEGGDAFAGELGGAAARHRGGRRTLRFATEALAILYLIRHAEMRVNAPPEEGPGGLRYAAVPDAPLTARGQRQAERLGQRLEGAPLVAVYSSPYRRAAETAQAIARPHGLRVLTKQALVERDFGEWDGLSADEIGLRHPLGADAFDLSADFAPPGGETLVQVLDRSLTALTEIVARDHSACTPTPTASTDADVAEGRIAVVAHKTVNRVLLCHWLGLPLECFRSIGQDNAAVNVISATTSGPQGEVLWRVRSANDVCHVEGL
ncbi:MAG: histidine phosphatase family protein, partial [Armatimonadota bacterium]